MGWLGENWNEQTNNQLAGRLSELCVAVGGREADSGEVETLFTIANGLTKARPTEADMVSFIRGQEAIRDTLIEIQVAVKALVDRTETSGTGTITSIGSDIEGSGTLFTTELSVKDTIIVGSKISEISEIADNTHFTVTNVPEFSSDSFTFIPIESQHPKFVIGTSHAVLTHDYIIETIGITDKTGSKDFSTTFNWSDGSIWERLRQYLNFLLTVFVSNGYDAADADNSITTTQNSAQQAWDAAIALISNSDVTSTGPLIAWEVHNNNPLWRASISEASTTSYDFSGLNVSGTITKAEITVETSSNTGLSDTHSWDGENIAIDNGDNDTEKVVSVITSASLSASFNIDAFVVTPLSVPFTPPSVDIWIMSSFLPSPGLLSIWVDLILADQS